LIDGQATLTTTRNNDTFQGRMALNGLPEDRDLKWWCDTAPIQASFVGNLTGNDRTFVTGFVTQVQVDLVAGLVSVQGKDKASRLVNRRADRSFRNRRPQQVMTDLAGEEGLSVSTRASELFAGLTADDEWTHILDLDTAWNAITALAERQGRRIVVRDDTIDVEEDDDAREVFTLRVKLQDEDRGMRANFTKLILTRNLELTGRGRVTVRSYDQERDQVVTARADAETSGDGAAPQFEYRLPGLNQEQANEIARRRLAENTKHERSFEVTSPEGFRFDPKKHRPRLVGTDTAFDQIYHAKSATFRFGDKFEMSVNASNKSEKGGSGRRSGRRSRRAPAQSTRRPQAAFPMGGV
jgi:hypothetical protein